MVELILRKDVPDLGRAGEMVQVRAGYARNYLIPQGIGLPATEGNRKSFEDERDQVEKAAEREGDQAKSLAAGLEGQSVTFSVRAGEEGQLFGSVTAADIAEKLGNDGFSVERRFVKLEDPIKELGVYDVSIRLHADVEVVLKVWVVAEK